MAFYCTTMLAMALELARTDPSYEDIASKFFEHFVAITDAMNSLGGTGLWDEEDGFYYDRLALSDQFIPLKIRSMTFAGVLTSCFFCARRASAMARLACARSFSRCRQFLSVRRLKPCWAHHEM